LLFYTVQKGCLNDNHIFFIDLIPYKISKPYIKWC